MLGVTIRVIIAILLACIIFVYVANLAQAAFFYESALEADGIVKYKSVIGTTESYVRTYFETEGNTNYYVKYKLITDFTPLNWWCLF